MKDLKEFYILGLPVETPIGKCNFIKVKDYPDYYIHLSVFALTKEQIIQNYQESLELDKDLLTQYIEEIKVSSLFTIVTSTDLKSPYIELFQKIFDDEEVLTQINETNFDYYRKLVMNMNCVKEVKINPNPEIQKWIDKSNRLKQSDDKLDFADIASSIVGYNGLTYEHINNFTLYQFYMTFQRIAKIKGYDTSTLFATVAEKVDIQQWCGHIDLFEDNKFGMSREEFNKKANGIFGK